MEESGPLSLFMASNLALVSVTVDLCSDRMRFGDPDLCPIVNPLEHRRSSFLHVDHVQLFGDLARSLGSPNRN